MIGPALLALLVGCALVLCIGLPLAWLFVASQVQVVTDNVGAAFTAGFVGFLASIPLVLWAMARVNDAYQRARVARGLEDTGAFPVETAVVITATLTAIGFAIWFFGFSGAQPLPFTGND